MNKQIILELIQLLGANVIRFEQPITVKMSPHSQPQLIHAAWIQDEDIIVLIDDVKYNWNEVDQFCRQSLFQRLRYMVSFGEKSQTLIK